MALSSLTRSADLEKLLAARGTGFIFKHSTRCGISAEADAAFRTFLMGRPEIPAWKVLVIEDRPVSDAVAARLGIPHASPQAILVRNGAPIWSASHWDITSEALEEAWLEAPGDRRGTP